ncbi:UDP-glucuronosyltransferase 2B1-like [Lingula anatina]|uniref:UDP-glucuronosyltransferase n=1 Tax=Lingula anatina TaxID=7574 RepID=A0A1S3JCM1_LINAN|nr:UDP-glucuronosyltransferase 2B1-like [Lingula anatina]|eukprot:XP_013407931.1 UDP-glucuronosyltransferase 2B1-like [Lingula anatina]
MPGIGKSVTLVFHNLAKELHKRGHQVYVIVGSNFPIPDSTKDGSVNYLTFKTDKEYILGSEEFQRNDVKDMIQSDGDMVTNFRLVRTAAEFFTSQCAEMLEDQELFVKLSSFNFDVAVIGAYPFLANCQILPYKLDLPVISITSFTSLLGQAGLPLLPSVVPSLFTTFTEHMDFMERVQNFVITLVSNFIFTPSIPAELVQRHVPHKPIKTFNEFLRDSILWLVISVNPALEPIPTLPNVILLGGMGVKQPAPLPDHLEAFVQKFKSQGVVVVSFGSVVKYLPTEISKRFLSVFSKLKYGVVWRYSGEDLGEIPPNIKLMSWLPQSDLLAHESVKVFLSHCGNAGSYEALFNGVPVLAMPIAGDQPHNAERLVKRGLAIKMSVATFSPGELLENINILASNSTYQSNAKRYARILRDYPMSLVDQAVYWIEHVVRFGGSHLQSPGAQLPWYIFYSLDVIGFLLSVVVLGVYCIKILCRACRRKCDQNPATGGDKKKQ